MHGEAPAQNAVCVGLARTVSAHRNERMHGEAPAKNTVWYLHTVMNVCMVNPLLKYRMVSAHRI